MADNATTLASACRRRPQLLHTVSCSPFAYSPSLPEPELLKSLSSAINVVAVLVAWIRAADTLRLHQATLGRLYRDYRPSQASPHGDLRRSVVMAILSVAYADCF